MSDRSGETTAARLPRNRSRLCAKNWLVIPDHSSKPICTLLLTKISRVANNRALLLPSRANKPNLAHHHKVPHRQAHLALNRPSLDRHPERSRGIRCATLKLSWRNPSRLRIEQRRGRRLRSG